MLLILLAAFSLVHAMISGELVPRVKTINAVSILDGELQYSGDNLKAGSSIQLTMTNDFIVGSDVSCSIENTGISEKIECFA